MFFTDTVTISCQKFSEYSIRQQLKYVSVSSLILILKKQLVISEEEYLRMIELKTAVLIAASAKIGAIIGGADDKDSDLLYEFGRNLGLAFQIQDDLLDIYGDIKDFRKDSWRRYNFK